METARVIEEHKTNYLISHKGETLLATVRGSFFEGGDFPKVGDWVLFSDAGDGKAVIEEIKPRTSTVVRKAVETGDSQVIVVNVDIIFIVMGLDDDFNLSRLERYLLLATQSGVEAVVILNKTDIVEDVSDYLEKTKAVAEDVSVHVVSAEQGENMEALLDHFTSDVTAVLLGSSGAGKSTITNWLLGEKTQSVRAVRKDDSRGRHTTTSRQMFELPQGGYLIDTPGMRELGLPQGTEEDEGEVFKELDALAVDCKFSNCDHEKSVGCAIVEAVEAGRVEERQWQNYLKLQRERVYEESKQNKQSAWEYKQKQKKRYKL